MYIYTLFYFCKLTFVYLFELLQIIRIKKLCNEISLYKIVG